ncbi:MAG: tetratricopeptide repeat protein [Bacteroidia bacterium]|nr:tetratricopeptide repeat protein [Bacteroidia bacterium]
MNEFSYFYCVISTDSSLKYAEKARTLAQTLNFKIGLAKSFINIGRVYYYQDNFAKALQWDLDGLKVYEGLKNDKGIADCLRNIGNVYFNQKLFDKSLDFYHRGLAIYEKLHDKKGIANCLRGIANNYIENQNYDQAREYYSKALKLYEEIKDIKNLGTCYSSLGSIYQKSHENELAYEYQMKGLKIKEEIGDKKGIAIVLNSLGTLFIEKKNIPKALEHFNKALEVSKEIKSLDLQLRNYESLSKAYVLLNNYTKAYDYYVLFKHANDSLINKETLKNQTQLEMNYEFEKEKQKAELEQQKKDVLKVEEMNRLKIIGIASLIGFMLMIFLFVMIYKNYRTKKKANELLTLQKKEIEEKNQILNQQNEEIKTQRDELELQSKFLMKQGDKIASQHEKIKEQMAIVTRQKKEIMDSIHYAKRIQLAILPPDDYINKYLEKHFILYKPKDIVSGDFYWVENVENKILFTAVDCTGHGVPGAFMSIVGHNGLDRAVREQKVFHPGEILDVLDDFVVETLRQINKTEVKDGMDIAFCSYNFDTNDFEFAGANNPLYIVRLKPKKLFINDKELEPSVENDTYALYEIKGDKQPIGAVESRKKFSNYTFKVEPGDAFYVFSDGYADQFGGPKGKKFKYSQLKEIIIQNQHIPVKEQKDFYNKIIEDWKGKLEQLDDILVLGVSFPEIVQK